MQPITRIQAYRILSNAAKQVGVEEIGTPTLRKTFGYHFYKKTNDVAKGFSSSGRHQALYWYITGRDRPGN